MGSLSQHNMTGGITSDNDMYHGHLLNLTWEIETLYLHPPPQVTINNCDLMMDDEEESRCSKNG